jgi:AcrR family transcriptional regulator
VSDDGRTRRAQETREVRRAQILEAATRVFAEHGYHGTCVSDLVSAAGVARGTFYLYFESKDQIFLALLDGLLVDLRSNVHGVDLAPGAAPMLAQLQGIVSRILRAVVENRALTRIIFREAVALDARIDERLVKFYADLHGWVARSLVVGQALGSIRAFDVELAASCIVGCFRGVVQSLVVETDAPVDTEEVARGVLDFALFGVSSPDGVRQ